MEKMGRAGLQGWPTGLAYRAGLQGWPTGLAYRAGLQGWPTGLAGLTQIKSHISQAN